MPPASSCPVDPVPQVRELLASRPDLTYKAIGALAGCSPGRVSQIAARYGLARGQGQRPTPFRDICRQLKAQGLTPSEIVPIVSEQFKRPITRQAVHRACQDQEE